MSGESLVFFVGSAWGPAACAGALKRALEIVCDWTCWRDPVANTQVLNVNSLGIRPPLSNSVSQSVALVRHIRVGSISGLSA